MKNKELVLLLREMCNGLRTVYVQILKDLPEDSPRESYEVWKYTEETIKKQQEWQKENPYVALPEDLLGIELKERQVEFGEPIILRPFEDYIDRLEDAISSFEGK